MKYGTIIVDPPWPYQKTSRHGKLTGYSDVEYDPLTIDELAALPVGKAATDESVLLLWTTWPFVHAACHLIEAWGFEYTTGLPWVKVVSVDTSKEDAFSFKPEYGVGYWFRGATEVLLVGSRNKAYRTNYIGLISKNAKHSRKPDSLYELAEATLPGPYLELFARRTREGWTQLGIELEGDWKDIRESLSALIGERPRRTPVL